MRELRIALREKRQELLVQERPCKPSRSTLLPQLSVCKCWPRDVNQLKSEVADHQVSGSYRERRSAIEIRFCLDER